MLVLTRKVGESICIGDNITLVVTKSAGNRVTLGIEAPRDVRIVRGELEAFVDQFQGDAAEDEEEEGESPPQCPAVAISFPSAEAATFIPSQAR